MKVLGTNVFLTSAQIKKLEENDLAYVNGHNQFRVICGCKSMADANRKCASVGLSDRTFQSAYTAETGNKQELEVAGNGGVFIVHRTTAGIAYFDARGFI